MAWQNSGNCGERTESALGEDFDLEDYHLQILTNGPRNFNIVETDLKKYVESKGKVWPTEFTIFKHERPEGMIGIGGVVNFVYQHRVAFIIGAIVAVILILLLLFFIIRGIIRLIFGKKKKKKEPTLPADYPNEEEEPVLQKMEDLCQSRQSDRGRNIQRNFKR